MKYLKLTKKIIYNECYIKKSFIKLNLIKKIKKELTEVNPLYSSL